MASTIPIRFSPQALSRPNNTRNPRSKSLPPKKLPSKPKPNHRDNRRRDLPSPSLSTVYGCEATTYTRLPPKHDFALPSLDSSPHSSAVVKLSESEVAAPNAVDREKEQSSSNLGFDYGKFELFEVNSDNEDEDCDEDEDEDYIDYGAEQYESNSNLGSFNSKFELFEVNSDSDEEEEEEDYGLKFTGSERGEDGSEGEGEVREKEKGLPAVMRCFDRAKIFVKAGDGGNGVVAFRREKYVPFGGPSGGDGGRGGNVYIEVDGSMNSLLPFRQNVHFRGGRGAHGQGRKMNGAKGEDVVVKVAPGTVIREAVEGGEGERGEGEVLLELLYPGQRALLLPGGRGGRGNASFKTGNNKVPRIAENGEEGPEMWLELELKLVADVGIIGAPNAGKSTLLSVVSAAQPAIANYPFTTLLPNLGVVSFDYDTTMVVADLPGLLEGAHRGFGLGHEFLRHTERCSALVHVVDGSSQQPEYEFDAVRLELELFNPDLAEKPYLVAYNKMDLPEASERWKMFKEKLQAHGIEPFCMSAVKSEGTHEVICAAYELVRKRIEDNKEGGWKYILVSSLYCIAEFFPSLDNMLIYGVVLPLDVENVFMLQSLVPL